MSGNTKGSSRQPTTSSGQKRSGRYGSSTPPEAVTICFNQDQVGKQFGWVVVISPERRYTLPKHRAPYVHVRCTGCGAESWVFWGNLRRGKTNGCQACSQPRRIPKWLDRRLTAAKGRCENPNSPQWDRYGGRGIQFKFPSVLAAGLWVTENLGLEKDKEIDRVDNDGHYEPGNLRWATRAQQNWNKGSNVREQWAYRAEEWPYERNTVKRKIQEGRTRDEILEQAHLAVAEKRKGWRRIEARLASMTS